MRRLEEGKLTADKQLEGSSGKNTGRIVSEGVRQRERDEEKEWMGDKKVR